MLENRRIAGPDPRSVINLPPNADDGYDNVDNIKSGANGVCETTAKNVDITAPENTLPSATDLQNYLNTIAWGRQANIFFAVTRAGDSAFNFDENSDELIDPTPNAEIGAIGSRLGDNDPTTFHLYYTGMNFKRNSNGDLPKAFAYLPTQEAIFSPDSNESNGRRINRAAHEIGHLLGRTGESPLMLDLMYGVDSTTNPCRIRKSDWDLINITNPQN